MLFLAVLYESQAGILIHVICGNSKYLLIWEIIFRFVDMFWIGLAKFIPMSSWNRSTAAVSDSTTKWCLQVSKVTLDKSNKPQRCNNLGTNAVFKVSFGIYTRGQILHVFLLFPPPFCPSGFSIAGMQKAEFNENVTWCTPWCQTLALH